MAKKSPAVEIHSCGLYDGWNRGSKELPNLVAITNEIAAELDIEFGYILRIRNARNCKITFRIEHPSLSRIHRGRRHHRLKASCM